MSLLLIFVGISCSTMQTFREVVDELVKYADHAEPYCSTVTRAPSTMFCCLHKFLTMKLTDKQVCLHYFFASMNRCKYC